MSSKLLTEPVRQGPRTMDDWRSASRVSQSTPTARRTLDLPSVDPDLLDGGLDMSMPERTPAKSLAERLARTGRQLPTQSANFSEDEFMF